MSTPAIRAMSLPLSLTLLVLRLRADHEDLTVAPNDLALVATLLDGRSYLQALVPHPPRDSAALQVVRTQFDEDLVPWDDTNEVHPHLPRDVRQDCVPVLELDLEHRVWEGFGDGALHLDHVLGRLVTCHGLQTQGSPRRVPTGTKIVPKPPKRSNGWSCGGHRLALGSREDDRPGRRASEGVLEVGREAAVRGDDGPLVGKRARFRPAGIDHRFDRDAEPLLYLQSPLGRAVVRDLRLLVHRPPDPVADVIADDAQALALDEALDRRSDVAQALADDRRRDGPAQRLLRDRDELRRLCGDLTDRDSHRRIGVPALDDRAGVDADDLPFLEPALARDAMHDLLVQARADHTGERRKDGDPVPLEVRYRAASLQDVGGDPVELAGGHARAHRGAACGEDLGHDPSGLAHLRGLLRRLQRDHQLASFPFRRSRIAVRRAPISSIAPTPGMRWTRPRLS